MEGTALTQMALAAAPSKPQKKKYRPLDVHTWGDGCRLVSGWLLVVFFAVLSGGLMVAYELKFINIQDKDVRDMSYDFRVTQWAVQNWHVNFVNAQACCNQDEPIYNISLGSDQCTQFLANAGYPYPYSVNQTSQCPPRIIFQCYGDLKGPICNRLRSIVYPAMGLSLTNGEYTNCSLGGKLLVGSQSISTDQEASILVEDSSNVVLSTYRINASSEEGISSFVSQSIQKYASSSPTAFTLPYTQILNGVLVDGIQANLSMFSIGSTGQIAQIGDQWAGLFAFPGMGAGCPNTSSLSQFYMEGAVDNYRVGDFDKNRPQDMISSLSFFNSSIQFAQWRATPVVTGRQAAQSAQIGDISVSMVQSIKVKVGMVPQLGSCYAWTLSLSRVAITYGPELYSGPISGLNVSDALRGKTISLGVKVSDVSAPVPIELPSYGGMWYLALTIGMGGIWLFGLGIFLVFVPCLIWQSVRINNGLPPVNYRANKKFRGW